MRLKTDRILFLTIVAMTCFGLIMVYSSSSIMAEQRYHKTPYYFALRQFGWVLGSFIALMLSKNFDYRRLNSPAWAFSGMGIVLALLVVVYFTDQSTHRWLQIPGV